MKRRRSLRLNSRRRGGFGGLGSFRALRSSLCSRRLRTLYDSAAQSLCLLIRTRSGYADPEMVRSLVDARRRERARGRSLRGGANTSS